MGDTDYDGGGFHDSDDGVFGDPGSGGGSASDYDNWDWKQIMAAINGMAAGTDSSSNVSHAASVSDPQTLQDAANAFYQVQTTLAGIAKALTDQTTALAGDDGPWKGDAADAFHDMMQTFSKQVQANADMLGGGSGGGHSVPQQLADNAVNLANAQAKIVDIDNWYAHQAVLMGVTPMDNGLIPIHEKPELVDMMTNDMRAVLKSLAGEYQVTIDSVHSPSGVNSPVGNPNPDSNPDTDGGPDITVPDYTPPAFDQGPPADYQAPNLSGMPFPGSTGTGGPGAFDPNGFNTKSALAGGPDVSPFGGGTGTDGSASPFANFAAMPNGGGLDGTGSDTLDPNALDNLLNPNASPTGFPGSTDVGGADGLGGTDGLGDGAGFNPAALSPSAFGGGTSPGGTGNLPKFNALASPNAFKSNLPAEDFPGSTSTSGKGVGLPGDDSAEIGDGLSDFSPSAFPGGTSTESGLPSSLTGGAFNPAGLEAGGPSDLASPYAGGTGSQGSGTPMSPGMGGMGGGAGQGLGGGEPSDASALLDPSAQPWTGDPAVDGEVGSEFGAGQGGEGLHLPGVSAAQFPGALGVGGADGNAAGMPMSPGMGGMGGGAGQGLGGGEPSDASALLDPSAQPWTGDPAVDGEVGSEFGAGQGGEGLQLPEGSADGNAEGVPGSGMPMMPGMGGMGGGQQSTGGGEPSDASALLDPTDEPWTGDSDVDGDEVGSATGTAPGVQSALLAPGDGETAAAQAGEGVPYLPYGGTGQAGGADGDADGRSEASALLAADAEPWTDDQEIADEPATAGASDTTVDTADTAGAPAAAGAAGAGATAAAVAAAAIAATAVGTAVAGATSAATPAPTPAAGTSGGTSAGAPVAATAPVAPAAPAAPVTPAATAPSGGANAPAQGQAVHATTEPQGPSSPFGGDDAEWTSELGTSGSPDAGNAPSAPEAPSAVTGAAAGTGTGPGSSSGSGSGSGDGSGSGARPAAAGQGHGSQAGQEAAGEHGGPAQHDRHQPDGLVLVGLPAGLTRRARDEDEEETDENGRGRSAADGDDDPPGGQDPEAADEFDTELPNGADGPDGDDPDGPDGPYGEGPDGPDHRVAVLRASEDEVLEEDTTAWDTGGGGFAPRGWSVAAEDDQPVRGPGYASADEGTWGETPPPAPAQAGAGVDEEPALATWKPSRPAAGSAGVSGAPAAAPISMQTYRSSAAVPDVPAETVEEPAADKDPKSGKKGKNSTGENDEDEAESRGIADLLVQDGNTWGAPPADPGEIG